MTQWTRVKAWGGLFGALAQRLHFWLWVSVVTTGTQVLPQCLGELLPAAPEPSVPWATSYCIGVVETCTPQTSWSDQQFGEVEVDLLRFSLDSWPLLS